MVEFLRRHDVIGKALETGGARDLRRVQQHVGGAADSHCANHRVADRIAVDDIARGVAALDHAFEVCHQLLREFVHPARVVRRRCDHVQRLHTDHPDEGLHGVIGEHAAAAAIARAGLFGNALFVVGIRVACDLKAGDDVDRGCGNRIAARVNRPV